MVTPQISVIMPVRDGAEFLADAIDSVLGQSRGDFELLVLDDGSTDASPSIARSRADLDPRVRPISLAAAGLPAALNHGISEARGRYVARADADDVNLPTRFAAQADFLDRHPEIGLCGAATTTMGHGPRCITRLPSDPRTLRCMLLFQSPLAHPTVMMRRELLVHCQYDPELCDGAEDYDLWERLADRTAFSNLPQVLCRRRVHPAQMSTVRHRHAESAARRVRERQLAKLAICPTAEEREIHQSLGSWEPLDAPALKRARRWLERIAAANAVARFYPEPELRSFLAERWYRACADSNGRGIGSSMEFLRSPLGRRRRAARLAIRSNVPVGLARALVRFRERLRGRYLLGEDDH
jgi:glycosyltransferase involved in cell wall biosynthesis